MIRERLCKTLCLTLGITSLGTIGACKKKNIEETNAHFEAPISVDSVAVTEVSMPRLLKLTGSLRGEREADVGASATGRVVQTYVERGQEVKQGKVVVKLDTQTAAISADEAKANAALARVQSETAKRECDRFAALLKSGTISQAEYDRAADQCRLTPLSAAAGAARAEFAEQVIRDGLIRAPFNGLIAERYVQVGQYVQRDTKIIKIVQVDPLRVEFTVPEVHLGLIRQGGEIQFHVAAYPDKMFTGVVRYIGASVRSATRDLIVEAIVKNTDRTLRPGMFTTIELVTSKVPTPVVPTTSLISREGRTHVYVIVNKRVEEHVVQTGLVNGDHTAILDGLSRGDMVVARPTPELRNGLLVK